LFKVACDGVDSRCRPGYKKIFPVNRFTRCEGGAAMIITITSTKGGVGQTTTAVNPANGFANRDRRVLLVDVDPQARATPINAGPLFLTRVLHLWEKLNP